MKPMKPSHFMNRVLLFVLLLVVGKGALSQERIDTLYYSRSGMTVRNPVLPIIIDWRFILRMRRGSKCSRIFIFRENCGEKGVFRQSIRLMIAGRCLTEMLFPISRMVACRKIILFGRIVGRRISAIRREWNVENTCVVCRRRIVRDVRGIQRRRLLPNGGISCRAAGS